MELATNILVILFVVAGVLCLYAALMNAEWFFRSPNVRILVGSLSRTSSRIIYAVIGLAILAMGAYIKFGPA